MAENEIKKEKRTFKPVDILGGRIFTDERFAKQIPFIFFLAFLGILAITNRNWSERTIRKMNLLKDSVIELKTRSVTYSAKLMDASRPSEIYDKVKKAGLGLEENVNPPKRIVVRK
jgi:hypothetical protein